MKTITLHCDYVTNKIYMRFNTFCLDMESRELTETMCKSLAPS